MALKDYFAEINDEVKQVLASDFEVDVFETNSVPNFDDSNITYDNLDTKYKKCKLLESCVLYVDMRDSMKISASKRPMTLSKIYSSFVKSMISAGRYYGGHVRNIIGDRVMIVFDKENCFKNAVNTSILMNSTCTHILNKHIKDIEFKAGIGIDYGKMLITKAGATRRGAEREFYRSLVWLGKPANIASRLTDMACKDVKVKDAGVTEGYYYPTLNEWLWFDKTFEQFLKQLEPTYLNEYLKHANAHFRSFYVTDERKIVAPPILMTKAVFDGFKAACPDDPSVVNKWIKDVSVPVRDYSGGVYGGNVTFNAVKEI